MDDDNVIPQKFNIKKKIRMRTSDTMRSINDRSIDENDSCQQELKRMLITKKHKRGTEQYSADIIDELGYSYEYLLNRLYKNMDVNKPPIHTINQKIILKHANVVKCGTKKVAFTNFGETCTILKRDFNDVKNFILTELSTTGSIDSNNCLIIRGRLTSDNIETQLRKYIKKYIMCVTCYSLDTNIEKNIKTRLSSIICMKCQSSRTISEYINGELIK